MLNCIVSVSYTHLMSEHTEQSNVTNVDMSESDLEPQSLNVSEMRTADPSAVTETAVGGNVIIHSTPIAAQMQLSETAVDSGIQLTPVLTNKNKQSDEMDIMSFLRKIDSKFDSRLNELRGELESRFNSSDDKINKRFDANDEKFEILSNDIKEHRIKCEQQNIKNDINFKELEAQNIELEQNISLKFDFMSNELCKRIDERFQIDIKRIDDDNVTRNTGKCNGNLINEVTKNKVSTDNHNNELITDNEIIKNVLESKVNDNSEDAVLVELESSNKIVVKERLCLQRANFSCGVNGAKTPIMSYEAVSYTHLDVYKRQQQ